MITQSLELNNIVIFNLICQNVNQFMSVVSFKVNNVRTKRNEVQRVLLVNNKLSLRQT